MATLRVSSKGCKPETSWFAMRVFSQREESDKALRMNTRKAWGPLRSGSAAPMTRSMTGAASLPSLNLPNRSQTPPANMLAAGMTSSDLSPSMPLSPSVTKAYETTGAEGSVMCSNADALLGASGKWLLTTCVLLHISRRACTPAQTQQRARDGSEPSNRHPFA